MKSIIVPKEIDALAKVAVDAAFHVHRELGPGLLESAYRQCLAHEFALRGIKVQQELAVPLICKGCRIDVGFRADLVAEDSLLLELKAVEAVHAVHEAQVITDLRVLGFPLGLLSNFNVARIKDGIRRKLNLFWRRP